ncbi:glycosyltransferase family A protein [Jiella sonneratiae]|uniref:Glycosyltransferase family 2 protein n=1 Tax=Jiella sonneratiae TaxID=2816856 RepID=A0ABS3J755_9HYPH|nr:glycosyltransferase family A protein [Jiella sonneratiae]MBO0905509.1 glycosyltransferase family 2 protein [Jiella sonneratiae]
MLSVFMDCGPDDRKLAATLSSLVPGAVDGIVREVVLVDRAMGVDARKVAEHAGCRVVSAEALGEAIGQARGDWLLLLEPGARLQPGWIAAVADHLETAGGAHAVTPAARFRRAAIDRPGFLARLRRRPAALSHGFLVRRSHAVGLFGKGRTVRPLEHIAKGVAVVRLDGEIRPAQP